MKYSLTVQVDSTQELADLIAKLGGTAPVLQAAATAAVVEAEEAPSVANVTGQVDSSGTPWDARIHSSSKKQNGDGTWSKRRGVSDADFAAISASLRAAPVAQAPAPVAQVATPAPAPVAPVLPPMTMPVAPAPVAMPAAPVIPPAAPPPAPVANAPVDLQGLMTRIQQAVAAKKLDTSGVQAMVAFVNSSLGLQAASIVDFASNAQAMQVAGNYLAHYGL